MKFYVMVFGVAIWTSLVPMRAYAQNFLQGNSGAGENFTAPSDGSSSGANSLGPSANPFMGAAGASKFYQDNSLAGSPPPNNQGTSSNSSSANGSTGGALGNAGDDAQTWATTP